MKEIFQLFGFLAKVEAVAAKVRLFFVTLAKVEVFYFSLYFLRSCRLRVYACIWCVS